MDTLIAMGMVLSVSGVGLILFSTRRRISEGGQSTTRIENRWRFAGGILLTVPGVWYRLWRHACKDDAQQLIADREWSC